LIEALNQEIEERKAKDEELLGTDDLTTIPGNYDSIYDLAEALVELQQNVDTLEEELKAADALLKKELQATVGTEEDDIVEYLKTLDYPSLTKVSEDLHKFLNTIDDTDTSINTLPELQKFLEGYEYTHPLSEVFTDFWNKIAGDPLPTT